MAQIIDQQAINERLNELRRSATILEMYAQPIFKITGTDPDFSQLLQIHSAPDHFRQIKAAKAVLNECGEKAGKRLTISDEQKNGFLKTITHVMGRINKKRTPGKYFEISKGTVRVDESKARKELEKIHVIEVDDQAATFNKWIQNLVTVINQAPDKGLRNRLGRFILMQNELLKGMKVTVDGDDLKVVEL